MWVSDPDTTGATPNPSPIRDIPLFLCYPAPVGNQIGVKPRLITHIVDIIVVEGATGLTRHLAKDLTVTTIPESLD